MKNLGRILAILLLSFAAIFSASAMRGTPAIVTLNYDPEIGLDEEFSLDFFSTNAVPGIADISFLYAGVYEGFAGVQDGTSIFNESQLKQYLVIDKKSLDLSRDSSVDVRIKIPPHADLAGTHEFGIIASERPKDGGGFFIVTTSVIIRVKIDIPYPGQYLDITKFTVSNINEGEAAKMSWQVKGRGEISTPFTASYDLLSKDGEVLYTKDLAGSYVNRDEVYPKDDSVLYLPTNNYRPDVYKARLTVKFTNMTKTSMVNFQVGTESLVLENYTSVLAYDEINQVTLYVRNLWNGRFSNVYATININGTSSTTPSAQFIDSFGTVPLSQYVNVKGMAEGNYSGSIVVFYGGKSMEFPVTFEIRKPVVIVEEETNNNLLYMGAGALLLILMVLLIVYFFKKRNIAPSSQGIQTSPEIDLSSGQKDAKMKKVKK